MHIFFFFVSPTSLGRLTQLALKKKGSFNNFLSEHVQEQITVRDCFHGRPVHAEWYLSKGYI